MSEQLSLKELCDLGRLSVRAFNICRFLRLETIEDVRYLLKNQFDFQKVRNCGQRTVLELEQLASHSQSEIIDKPTDDTPINAEIELIKGPKFEKVVREGFSRLSVRGQNAFLAMFFGGLPTANTFRVRVLNNPKFTIKQRNVGAKTFEELHNFFEQLKTTYKECLAEPLSQHDSALFSLENITGIRTDNTRYLDGFISNEFPLIEFCGEYLKSLLRLGTVEQFVFENITDRLDRNHDFEEIANKFKYSKERIRQISVNLKKEVPLEIKRKLESLIDHTCYKRLLENENFVDISVFFKAHPTQTEIDQNGRLFSGFVLASLFSEKYYLLSKLDKLVKPSEIYRYEVYREIKKIRGVYLVNKDIIEKAALLDILNLCFSERCKRQEQNKIIQIHKLVSSVPTISIVPAVKVIFHVLDNEFGLKGDTTGIQIEKNTFKMVYEYVVEALEALGRPSHVSVIHNKIKELNPQLDLTEESIKSVIPRFKKVFIFFGRSSTYGLRTWEKKFQNIKGGTIRDIAEEFLSGFNEPCHISAIAQYVNKYRKTNEYSIITNLKYSGETRFCFFKNGYVGLVKKNYNKQHGSLKQFEEISLDELLENIFSK